MDDGRRNGRIAASRLCAANGLCSADRDRKGQMASGVGRGTACGICSKGGPTGAFRASVRGACRYRFFTARRATRRSPTQRSIDHVADIFAKETADAWYNRPESELLPDGYKCAKCNSADFRKETDILDVWFDSGSSCVAVLETRGDNLRFPADVYLEGGDQYRGWFNSSLSCGIAAHDRAPYKQVVTHGWVVDGEGKKQMQIGRQCDRAEGDHRQSPAPRSCVSGPPRSTIPRMSAARTRYCRGIVDAYRKFRNTLRYAARKSRWF